MVKLALAIVAISVGITGVASADDDCDPEVRRDCVPGWQPYQQSLGMQVSGVTFPLDGRTMSMFGLGISFERRLAGRVRALAEYEYGWLGEDVEGDEEVDDTGIAHRGVLGLRVTLGRARPRKIFDGEMSFFVDLEGGAGMIGGSEAMTGDFKTPYAMVGVRLGYGFHELADDIRSSRTYEAGFMVRGIKTEHGTGVMGSVNIAWGD